MELTGNDLEIFVHINTKKLKFPHRVVVPPITQL